MIGGGGVAREAAGLSGSRGLGSSESRWGQRPVSGSEHGFLPEQRPGTSR